MSYNLVTREEITGITIYNRVEQIRSAIIIPIRIRNLGERNNKRYYEIIKGDTCKYIAAKILDKSLYYLETGETGKMNLKVKPSRIPRTRKDKHYNQAHSRRYRKIRINR